MKKILILSFAAMICSAPMVFGECSDCTLKVCKKEVNCVETAPNTCRTMTFPCFLSRLYCWGVEHLGHEKCC